MLKFVDPCDVIRLYLMNVNLEANVGYWEFAVPEVKSLLVVQFLKEYAT